VIVGWGVHHQSDVNASSLGFSCVMAAQAWLFWAAPAHAATGGHLAYRAPDGCPSQADFEASVAERGAHFDGAGAPDSGRELRVAIAQSTGGFSGSFQVIDAADASTTREVHGATCQEVAAALAVVSAIALRGDDAPNTASTPATPAPERTVQSIPEALLDEGHLRASSGVGSKKIEVSAGTLRFDLVRSLTLLAGGEIGVLSSKVMPRYDLTFTGANFITTPDGKSYIAGVIPRLRLSYLGSSSYRAADASVQAQGVSVGLGLCVAPTYDTRGFVALLCAEYALGVMQLKSRDAQGMQTQEKSPALQIAGVSFETEYNLGSAFHLGLKVGFDTLIQPISADRPDGTEIFHSSSIAGYGMLGFGVHF
jgi:hypothetical protein